MKESMLFVGVVGVLLWAIASGNSFQPKTATPIEPNEHTTLLKPNQR